MDRSTPDRLVRIIERVIPTLPEQDAGSIHQALVDAGIPVQGVVERRATAAGVSPVLITVDAEVSDAVLDAALVEYVTEATAAMVEAEERRISAVAALERLQAQPDRNLSDVERIVLYLIEKDRNIRSLFDAQLPDADSRSDAYEAPDE